MLSNFVKPYEIKYFIHQRGYWNKNCWREWIKVLFYGTDTKKSRHNKKHACNQFDTF